MKTSDINFKIELDEKNIPEKIVWIASDKGKGNPDTTNAIAIAIWDGVKKNTHPFRRSLKQARDLF